VIEGNWRVVSPETASWMSAVGYYFALDTQAFSVQYHVKLL